MDRFCRQKGRDRRTNVCGRLISELVFNFGAEAMRRADDKDWYGYGMLTY